MIPQGFNSSIGRVLDTTSETDYRQDQLPTSVGPKTFLRELSERFQCSGNLRGMDERNTGGTEQTESWTRERTIYKTSFMSLFKLTEQKRRMIISVDPLSTNKRLQGETR